MEGNGIILNSPNCKSHSMAFCSSTNYPFDELWKKTLNSITLSEQVNRRSSIGLQGDLFNIGRRSLSFHDIDTGDFGRESIGILPPDFGKDSSSFMNLNNSEIGRESLGILHINPLRDSLSFRRESLGLLALTDLRRESLDIGRESLGILHLKSPEFKFIDEEKNIPDILLSTVENISDIHGNNLNTAFLQPQLRKTSAASSTSSVNPSFNCSSLEAPSRIYSVSSPKSFENANKSDIFNRAFYKTYDISNLTYSNNHAMSSIHSSFNRGRLFSPTELHSSPKRIKSLPVTVEEDFEDFNDETDLKRRIERPFWTTDRTTRSKTLERGSFHGVLDFNDEGDISNDFHDSVFIEGCLIAEKIADGSILNDSSNGEIGILDCTPQPNWPDEVDNEEDKETTDLKCDKETIFKNVDKLLPAPLVDIHNFKIKSTRTDSISSNEKSGDQININETNTSECSEKSVSKLIYNISGIAHESNKTSVGCKSQSKSKDAKEIIHNLSEIINCTNVSDKQKSVGQNLLNSLADMLCQDTSKTKNASLDDSGHSSIHEQSESPNQETAPCSEVPDMCKKITTEDACNEYISKQPHIVNSRLTQSFSSSIPNIKSTPLNILKKRNSSASGLDLNKNKSTASSNSSVNSNDSKNSGNLSKPLIAGTLRRKTLCYGTKKGPMKAVIPIGDMKKKNNSMVTPEKTEQKISTRIQSNRTSTPINEPKLKPMAASTPTGRHIKDKKSLPVSPLARPKSTDVSSTSGRFRASPPTPLSRTSIKLESMLVRRNSVSEVKKASENISKIQRSNSIEKGTGIMSSLTKVRQNIVNFQTNKQSILKENNSTGALESKTKVGVSKGLSDRKTTNLETKLKPYAHLTSSGHPNKSQSSNMELTSSTEKKTASSSDIQRDKTVKLTSIKSRSFKSESECVKRISVNDIKGNECKLKRKNSVGIMSSLPKIRRNILNSPYYQQEKENMPQQDNFIGMGGSVVGNK